MGELDDAALHLVARTGGGSEAAWQEAVEREVVITGYSPGETIVRKFAFPANRGAEGDIVREQQAVEGVVELYAAQVDTRLVRITVRVRNVTPRRTAATRDEELLRSLVSVHTGHLILMTRTGISGQPASSVFHAICVRFA